MTNLDPEAINARAAALQEATGERLSRMKRRNEAMLQAQSRMKNITATATSPDNAVQATVDSGGMLVDLRISPTAKGDIARLVVDAVQRAAAQVRSETHRLHEELRAEGVLRDIPLLPTAPTPQPTPSGPVPSRPAPSRPKPASRDDDDDEPRAVLRDEGW
jgi:DNA-binding protein YbaB